MGLFQKAQPKPPPLPPSMLNHRAPPQQAFMNASHGLASPYPLGHVPDHVKRQAAMMMKNVTRDLGNLKRMGVLDPRMGVVERWCEALGRALEPMTILGGHIKGMRDWLTEVQFLTARLKDRIYLRHMPLSPSERQAIATQTNYWLASRGGPTDTGQPHIQIIIMSLRELSRS